MRKDLLHPAVGVGMPVINGEKFVPEAINSILNQTFKNFELIVSDNASTGKTDLICKDFARRDSRIRYVRQPYNLGGAANFRFVFEKSEASFFMWAACDGKWAENWIECLLNNFSDQDARVFGAYYEEDDTVENKAPKAFSKSSFIRFFLASDKTGKCYYSYALFRSLYLKKADFSLMTFRVGADQIFLLNMLSFGDLKACSETQFYYRIHDDGVAACQAKSYGIMKRYLLSIFPLEYYQYAVKAVPLPYKISMFLTVPIKDYIEQTAPWKHLFLLLIRKVIRVFCPVLKEQECR